MIPLSNITAAGMVKNIGVVGRWQSRRRTRVCGHRHIQFCYSGTFGRQNIAWGVFALCDRERQRAGTTCCGVFAPKQSFLGLVWPWCALSSIFCASKMGELDNHSITALCGSSGEDENSGWSIYVHELKARDANYKVVGKSKKSQKEEKESEERSGRWYPGCRRYCVWPRHCRLTECDLLWRPMMRFSVKKWPTTFPEKWGHQFGVTTVHAAQRGEFALHPGYTKLLIPKTIGNRKRDCAWGCARGINTTWEICRSKSTNQDGIRSAHRTDLCFSICRFSQVVFIPWAQPHAQSHFQFPIVFGINLIHFFDEKKDGAAGIRSFVSVLRSPVTLFDRSDEECELFRRVQRIYVQRKCELSAIQEGSPRKRNKFLARKSAKLFANTKLHILARKSAKLVANFSATEVTSLPSHSLSLSLSLCISLSFTERPSRTI